MDISSSVIDSNASEAVCKSIASGVHLVPPTRSLHLSFTHPWRARRGGEREGSRNEGEEKAEILNCYSTHFLEVTMKHWSDKIYMYEKGRINHLVDIYNIMERVVSTILWRA